MASMDNNAVPSGLPIGRRDRPWLLPSNRKLRNLVSISLRNLSFDSRASGRPRRQTIDDGALPQTLKSPAKIVAQREYRVIEHSRSSEDLKTLGSPIRTCTSREDAVDEEIVRAKPTRPSMRRNRRSTLDWANATPQRRQERLERVTQDKLADVFFSLHVHGVEEPVYVSETAERTMNPTFRHIDFSACGPALTRLDHVILRVWAKIAKSDAQWREWTSLDISMEALRYLGKSLQQLDFALPHNAIVLHLTDGIYMPRTNFILPPASSAFAPARANSNRVLQTSSFDALLRLANLDDSIQDAMRTRDRLAPDLEALFAANKAALVDREEVVEVNDRIKTIDYAKKTVEKQLEKAVKQTAEKRESLAVRRNLMQADVEHRQSMTTQMQKSSPELHMYRDERAIRKQTIQNQRRRVCEDLQEIYPINPIAGKSLDFTIRGLRLPNSDELDNENSDTVAAALGNVAHAVLMLSFYLQQPLPYPVSVRGSSSTIMDPISLLKSTNASRSERSKDERVLRTYPLFSRGAPRFKFEYAVFLLNKDVQILLETAFKVRVLDLRQTLPNLKYLLYVATAGEGELPARKSGGVRGLVKARRGVDGRVERTASEDSMGSTLVGSVQGAGDGPKPSISVPAKKAAMDSLRRTMGNVNNKK